MAPSQRHGRQHNTFDEYMENAMAWRRGGRSSAGSFLYALIKHMDKDHLITDLTGLMSPKRVYGAV